MPRMRRTIITAMATPPAGTPLLSASSLEEVEEGVAADDEELPCTAVGSAVVVADTETGLEVDDATFEVEDDGVPVDELSVVVLSSSVDVSFESSESSEVL